MSSVAEANEKKLKDGKKIVDEFLKDLEVTHASLSDKISLWFAEAHNILQSKEKSLLLELDRAVSLYRESGLTCKDLIARKLRQMSVAEKAVKECEVPTLDTISISKSICVTEEPGQSIELVLMPFSNTLDSLAVTHDENYCGPLLLSDEDSSSTCHVPKTTTGSLTPSTVARRERKIYSLSPSVYEGSVKSQEHCTVRSKSANPCGTHERRGRKERDRSSPLHSPFITPKDGSCDVFVTHVENVEEFYIQTKEQREKLNALTLQLNDTCTGGLLPPDEIFIGMMSVVHMSYVGELCRARVEMCFGNGTVRVQSVDWGVSEVVDKSRVNALPESLLLCAPLCSLCCLGGIFPLLSRDRKSKKWPLKAVSVMRSILSSSMPKIKILDWDIDGKLFVDLLCPVTGGYISLCDELVFRGLGVKGKRAVKVQDVPSPIVLANGDQRNVAVACAENPFDFYVQLESQLSCVQQLYELAQQCGSILPMATPRVGMLCLAKYEADQQLCRGRILNVEKDRIEVFFFDFGNKEVVSTVYPLSLEMREIPALALKCSLDNVRPVDGSSWSEKSASFFYEGVVDDIWTMTVRNVCRNGTEIVVELTSAQGVSIGDTMVSQGMARFKTELFHKSDSGITSVGITPRKEIKQLVREVSCDRTHSSPDASLSTECEVVDLEHYSDRDKVKHPKYFLLENTSTLSAPDHQFLFSVTMIERDLVFGHVITEDTQLRFEKICGKVDEECRKCPPVLSLPQMSVGELCCAYYAEDGGWYRACVLELSGQFAKVLFIDYGNSKTVQHHEILRCPIYPELPGVVTALRCAVKDKVEVGGNYLVRIIKRSTYNIPEAVMKPST